MTPNSWRRSGRWGDRLHEITRSASDSFGGRSRGVDRRVLIAQGWAHWGNATGNRDALADAYEYYVHALKSIGRNGRDRVWVNVFPKRRVYYANMTYGAAMSTAFALSRSGSDDVYAIAPGGGTLVEGRRMAVGNAVQGTAAGTFQQQESRKPVGGLDRTVRARIPGTSRGPQNGCLACEERPGKVRLHQRRRSNQLHVSANFATGARERRSRNATSAHAALRRASRRVCGRPFRSRHPRRSQAVPEEPWPDAGRHPRAAYLRRACRTRNRCMQVIRARSCPEPSRYPRPAVSPGS